MSETSGTVEILRHLEDKSMPPVPLVTAEAEAWENFEVIRLGSCQQRVDLL